LKAHCGSRWCVAIETCVLLALSGQQDKVELLASGVDVYRDMAAQIFGLDRDAFMVIPKAELTLEQEEQRRVGKNTVLGCGYSMGSEKFQQRYLHHLDINEAKVFAEEVVYRHYHKEWAPMVPRLWYDLEYASKRAMFNPGVEMRAECGIAYRMNKKTTPPRLECTLLNGKVISYQNAAISKKKFDKHGRPLWTYWTYRKNTPIEVEPYGGQLTENVVQALARELLVHAMLNAERRGFPVVMHCHDEMVTEHPTITVALMREIMGERPEWAVKLGVPVAVEAWVGKRYRK
jgi:DNA polymerase